MISARFTEGVRGKRAVEGRFVDADVSRPASSQEAVAKRAQELAAKSDRPARRAPGITLGPLTPSLDGDAIAIQVRRRASIDRAKRTLRVDDQRRQAGLETLIHAEIPTSAQEYLEGR